ncbi:uncharacterized protein LOC111465964 [Cucurbita maxima]|uniref:Uncharacterized protein LOC111465964 n=1 Tax=Cucurbita maxima TaxID=3661 RepID=A0A6J1HR39_CUCMA|nr:uncharacterized protein LOC111465964 [Cucurbita maxima]
MDGDLWDWPYDQGFSYSDAGESSYSVESGWQADFYFGYGRDVIEENAMNEKYCVQVLKILIRKAASEIDDLEEDLVLLQCGLAWTESRNQFEACCNALREKIDVLHNSIKSWRRSDKINTVNQLPLHTQPAEKLFEILKPFLGEGREQDDGQDQHATLSSQGTDTSMQLVGPFCETSSISGIKVKSEEMEVKRIFPAVYSTPNGSVQKHPKNDSICKKEIKAEISVEGVSSNVIVTEENLKPVSKVKIEEVEDLRINNSCKSRKLKSASNVGGECRLLNARKQHGKSIFENANPDVPRQSDGFSGNKRSFDSVSSSPASYPKSGNCNTEDKLIDFLLRKKKNKNDGGSILPESNGSAPSCSSSNTKEKVDCDLRFLDTKKTGTFDSSNLPTLLLSKLQNQQGNDLVRTQTKETNKLLLDDYQNVENVCHEKSYSNMDHKPKLFTEKGRSKSHTPISKAKKHRKPGAVGDNACLDLPLELCQLRVEKQDCALDIEKNLGPLSQNKGTSKMLVGQELIEVTSVNDISSSDQIKPDDSGTGENKQMKSCAATTDDHIAEILALLPSSDLKLKSLAELRIIAKEHNLTKYHKLRKRVLLDLLVQKLLE